MSTRAWGKGRRGGGGGGGGTGSGKTTTLGALSAAIPDGERIVTIEDAAELRLRQRHVVRLESRPANLEGRGEVTIRALVRNALRMRPDRIVVGEVRGAEALDMLMALNTGHEGSLTTVHANSPEDALRRIETLALMAGGGPPPPGGGGGGAKAPPQGGPHRRGARAGRGGGAGWSRGRRWRSPPRRVRHSWALGPCERRAGVAGGRSTRGLPRWPGPSPTRSAAGTRCAARSARRPPGSAVPPVRSCGAS